MSLLNHISSYRRANTYHAHCHPNADKNIYIVKHVQQLAPAARQEPAEEFATRHQISFRLAATAAGRQKHSCNKAVLPMNR
jgi:hypothetical protein